MAITLDELLEKDVKSTNSAQRFPDYEEFASQRAASRRESETRDYEGSRAYVDTRENNIVRNDYRENAYYDPYRRYSATDFYDYAARDNSRLTEDELMSKLAHTQERTYASRETAERAYSSTKKKVRGRLNTKGKIALGAFLCVVVAVMSLIIAFGSKINSGTAVMPASNTASVSISQSAEI